MRIALPVLTAILIGGAGAASAQSAQSPIMQQLAAFLGNGNGDYFWPEGRLVNQVSAGLSMPDEALKEHPITLKSGESLKTGFRLHSGDEKTAVIFGADNKVSAVGILNFKCSKKGGRKKRVLTIFLKNIDQEKEHVLSKWSEIEGGVEQTEVILMNS